MLLAAPWLLAGKATVLDREFRKVERRLYGSDEDMKNGCRAPAASFTIEDRETERERSIEVRRSDLHVRGSRASDLRACARAIAKAGVVDGWRLAPASEGEGYLLSVRLLRARRDPKLEDRGEKGEKEAAGALTSFWADRRPIPEAMAPELLAQDLVTLDEASWNAGTITIEARAADPRLADGYRRLVEGVLAGGPKVDWKLEVRGEAPPAPPALADSGALRAAIRDAKPAAVLRLLARLDRRDYVIPSGLGTERTGSIGGGWPGIVAKLAADVERTPLHVGAIDVFAPTGTRAPKPAVWSGRKVVFELAHVKSNALYALFTAAGGVPVTGPALGDTDLQLRGVPWDQALEAVAIAHGCVIMETKGAREVRCAGAAKAGAPEPAPSPDEATPDPAAANLSALERHPASALRVVALGRRDSSSKTWRAIVGTPDGDEILTQTGTVLGLDGGRAVVDEKGVAIVLERADSAGTTHLAATLLRF